MISNKTLEYYDKNAEEFSTGTLNVDFADIQNQFLTLMPKGGLILDFGCGSGRDTKYFLDKGYEVEAVDGSGKMCEYASNYTGITVKQMLFQELNEVEKYDGIWACASILHVPGISLPDILERMSKAAKGNGVIYVSFKYGNFEGERDGRYFTDLTEDAFAKLIRERKELRIEEEWISADVRPGREEQKWLNIILRKTDIN